MFSVISVLSNAPVTCPKKLWNNVISFCGQTNLCSWMRAQLKFSSLVVIFCFNICLIVLQSLTNNGKNKKRLCFVVYSMIWSFEFCFPHYLKRAIGKLHVFFLLHCEVVILCSLGGLRLAIKHVTNSYLSM